jgi:hypothetical protein
VIASVACLAAIALLIVGLVVLARARRKTTAKTTPAPADPFRQVDADADSLYGDPRTVKPGDLIEIRGTSYAVRGTLRFTEGDWGWAEHLLDDAAGRKVWLSVEEDPDLELVLWHEVPTATVTPDAPTVDFDGRRYVREESGRARYTAIGTTGLNPQGTVQYHDYAAPDGPLLSFEAYGDGGRWEVGRGERLHRSELRIYPQAG